MVASDLAVQWLKPVLGGQLLMLVEGVEFITMSFVSLKHNIDPNPVSQRDTMSISVVNYEIPWSHSLTL